MGRKFVIELEDKPFRNGCTDLYKVKGFNSLVFDQNGIDKLQALEDYLGNLAISINKDASHTGDEYEDVSTGERVLFLTSGNREVKLIFRSGHVRTESTINFALNYRRTGRNFSQLDESFKWLNKAV